MQIYIFRNSETTYVIEFDLWKFNKSIHICTPNRQNGLGIQSDSFTSKYIIPKFDLFILLFFQGKFIRINFDASGYIAGANIGKFLDQLVKPKILMKLKF